ncbi:MAG TPA: hypothetical protein QF716_04780, partial [Candidatus Thalassarchaeaceae archaeon]|nr:hypothetical protein [Candidatus Thalassarchaeaceae archaeon]
MVTCQGSDCNKEVTKAGHHLCYSCWKKDNKKSAGEKTSSKKSDELLNATAIGKEFGGISGQKMNLILSELG